MLFEKLRKFLEKFGETNGSNGLSMSQSISSRHLKASQGISRHLKASQGISRHLKASQGTKNAAGFTEPNMPPRSRAAKMPWSREPF